MSKANILILVFSFLVSNVPVSAQGYDQGSVGSLYDDVVEGNGYQAPRGFDQGAHNPPPPPPMHGGFRDPGPQGYGQAPAHPQYRQGQQQPLKGRVVVAPAGSRFEARVATGISSSLSQAGDLVSATVTTPLVTGSNVLIPAGSIVSGQIVSVRPAQRFRGGRGGEIQLRFTSVQTPNGQRYPLNASVDTTLFKLSAETKGSRTAMGVATTAKGAGVGALAGLVGAAISGGDKSRAAAIGSGIGGGLGALKAVANKGDEINIPSGSILPINLEQALQAVIPPRQ